MNFGYLLVVSPNKQVDYLKMAYVLAMSIKHTQKEGYDKVALVIDDKTRLKNIKSPWVFDEVIESHTTGWDGRSSMDLFSPWENTVCLDADMIFLRDYSHYIDFFVDNCDLYMPTSVYTYRNEKIFDSVYRKCFQKNVLPNVYSMFTFFKKNQKTKSFFDLNRQIIKNSNIFIKEFLYYHPPKTLGTDEAFALAIKILGLNDELFVNLDFPKILHFKPMIQNWPWPAEKCTDHVGFYIDRRGQVKIGNYQQTGIIHYVEKDLITDEYVNIFEELIWKK